MKGKALTKGKLTREQYNTLRRDHVIKRELVIIKLICEEHTSDEIGEKVGISGKRVDAIRLELLRKTRSRNAIGIVKYAIKNKLYKVK
ncbi:MAG: hypothetical protein H0U95_18580 [Bacteroidetes bacterium]|nr:hypothetical protein [Bacteroidota bacterium]